MAEINRFTAKYEIADLKVLMTTYYDKMRELAKDYLAKSDWDNPDAELDVGLDLYEKGKEK